MRLALALAVLPAMPAVAAVEPCYIDQMVAAAPRVIQIVDTEVRQAEHSTTCTLIGTVARSFRGDLAIGTRVQTTFLCDNPEFEMVVGASAYLDADQVAAAGAIELHLQAGGGPAGYGAGMLSLDAPTDQPTYPFDYLPRDGQC